MPEWNKIQMDIKEDRQCTYKRNTEARFGNHCYDGKAIGITQPECVFVAQGIHHAMRMRHILICGIPHSKTYFHIISYTARISGKKNVIGPKMHVWISSTTFVWNISHSKNWVRWQIMYIGGYSSPILMKLELSPHFFAKYRNIKFHENPSSGSRAVPWWQAEGHDEANNRFSKFCECA